jgi:hypothetical protein
VEGYVVLAHELEELDILRVLPPLLPILFIVVGCNAEIANWSIEPDIENLVLVLLERNRSTPLQIASDASASEAFFKQGRSKLNGIRSPFSLFLLEEFLMLRLNLGQVDEDVL